MYRVITPETPEQFEAYYALRWRVLREPFQRRAGLSKTNMIKLATIAWWSTVPVQPLR